LWEELRRSIIAGRCSSSAVDMDYLVRPLAT
jgi:hypothetical protein